MKIKTTKLLTTATFLGTAIFASQASAQFKAKYYPDCYTPLAEARESVPKPPRNLGKDLDTAAKVGSVLGRFGGLGGLGGSLGNVTKATQAIQTAQQYSGVIQDVAGFTEAMGVEFPGLGDRFGAYGGKLEEDSAVLASAGQNIAASQGCYQAEYDKLVAGYKAGEMKKGTVKKQHKEIVKGVKFGGKIVADAQTRVNHNISAYNQAIEKETQKAGINLGALASLAASSGAVPKMAGLAGTDCSSAAWYTTTAASCARMAGIQNRCMPGQDCSINAVKARAAAGQNPNGSPMGGGALQSLSALGALGGVDGGTMGAASMLGGLMGGNSGTPPVDEQTLSGLVKAGGESSRYLQIGQGLQQTGTAQTQLAAYVKKSPTKVK